MLTIFLAAFALGLVFNAAPGAVFAATVREGAQGGFAPAFAVQMGSLVGDALWAALGLAGVGLLLQAEALRVPLGCAGVVYLLWLAVDAWRAASRAPVAAAATISSRGRSAWRRGVLLSVTNPQNVAYWAAIGSALGGLGLTHPTPTDYATFFVGFMASSLAWCFICAAIVHHVFRSIGATWARVTYRACAIAFVALAMLSVRDLVGRFAAP